MKEVTAIVERGQIMLPETVSLPDGARVRVLWDEDAAPPLEREPWTAEDMQADLDWATEQKPPA